MMIDSKLLHERFNDKSIIDWLDNDRSPQNYKHGYLSGLIKALAIIDEVEYTTEHGHDRPPIDFGLDDETAESLKIVAETINNKLKEYEITSHSENNIVNGCIALMESVHQNMIEYMDYMGFEYNEEDRPIFGYTYFEIIQTLLLQRTLHAGGTSTRNKCKQLGLDSYKTVNIGGKE